MSKLYSFAVPNRLDVGLDCGDEVITKQAMKDECDINNILRNYAKTGILTNLNQSEGQYLDLPSFQDLQSAFQIVQDAASAFSELPAEVREYFRNDPGQLLAALDDPSKHDELVKLGVINPPKNSEAPKIDPGGSGASEATA